MTEGIDINNLGDLVLDKMESGTHPLLHFTGKFVKVSGEYKKRQGSEDTYINLQLDFAEIKVLKSRADQAYGWPVTDIKFAQSQAAGSQFGVFSTSVQVITNRPTKLAELIGKVMEMEWTDGHIVQRPNEAGDWVDKAVAMWEVKSIEGMAGSPAATSREAPSGPSIEDESAVIALADGKDLTSIGKAMLNTDGIADSVRNISLNGQEEVYMANLVTTGKMTKDDAGVFHKV